MRSSWLLLGWILLGCAQGTNDDGELGGQSATGASSQGGETSTTGGAGGTTTGGGATGGQAQGGEGAGGEATGGQATGGEATGGAATGGNGTGGGGPNAGGLIFSEYVEGGANNKALEIVNTSSDLESLEGCVIDRYQNGSASVTTPEIALDAVTLGLGETWVICQNQISDTSRCDQLSGNISHTGNDVVVLVCGGVTRDSFGSIGDAAGWGSGAVVSTDATLRRKCSVELGDTNPSDLFLPEDEWDGFPVDTLTDLGLYTCPL